ncbi:helix-turn-helix transcriptional regulator [Myceligenerans halotolerans]
MNVDPYGNEPISPAVWERTEMRTALARRDLKQVYELLQRIGISQRSIARRTTQSPSEVYEILRGRQVLAHDVLVRIADGLGVPRGYMGVAYDESTESVLDMVVANISTDSSEREEARRMLSHAANMTMEADVADVTSWWQPVERQTAPVPSKVGASDVVQLKSLTATMRVVDYQYGGGACRDAIAAQVRWAQQLLLADATEKTRHDLLVALADLHNLAGWTSFDTGMFTVARRHFSRALEQAKAVGDQSLSANILYRMGRLHLHRGLPHEALRFFQLGQIAAQDSGCGVTTSMMCANEAWAYAMLGERSQMKRSLNRATAEWEQADRDRAAAWVQEFSRSDLHLDAVTGVVLTTGPDVPGTDMEQAIGHLTHALGRRGPEMARSRTFDLTALATAHLRTGDIDEGLRVGHEVVASATTVRSVRTLDRFEPLQTALNDVQQNESTMALQRQLSTLRGA